MRCDKFVWFASSLEEDRRVLSGEWSNATVFKAYPHGGLLCASPPFQDFKEILPQDGAFALWGDRDPQFPQLTESARETAKLTERGRGLM